MTYRHKPERDAHEAGYKEALLDVYVVLTNNPAMTDIEEVHYNLIEALSDQIAVQLYMAAEAKKAEAEAQTSVTE